MKKGRIKQRYFDALKKKFLEEPKKYLDKRNIYRKRELELEAHIKQYYKKPIQEKNIQLFYEDPKTFFFSFKNLLFGTSLHDISGFSIFAHYFYVLYTKNPLFELEIYENNFNNFFKELAQYLSMQDNCLETPLHKLAKLNNKRFFLEICERLKKIGVLSEKLLSIQNCNFQSCYDIVIDFIKVKKKKIIENDFQIYYDFLKFCPNLKKLIPIPKQKIINAFLFKVNIEEQNLYEININETLTSYKALFENLKIKKRIFEYIYYPSSGINQLDVLYECSFSEQAYQRLYEFVLELSKIQVGKSKNNDYHKYDNQCVAKHITYVLRNFENSKTKGNLTISYGLKLLEKILQVLIDNNKSEESRNLIYEKVDKDRKYSKYRNKGLLSSLMYNQYISLENKIDIYKKYYSKLNLDLQSFIENKKDKSFLLLYFYIFHEKSNELTSDKAEEKFKEIFDDFYFVKVIYSEVYCLCNKYYKDNRENYLKKLDDFFRKNYSDLLFEYQKIYGFSDENLKLLVDYIIKYRTTYFDNFSLEKIKVNFQSEPQKIIDPFDMWYSKFILTQPELFYSILVDMNNYQNIHIEGDTLKSDDSKNSKSEGMKEKYDQKMKMTLLRLFLILKYNFEEAKNNNELISLFNNKLGKNYLINNKNEILNLISSIKNESFEQLFIALLENPESLVLFQDEIESNEELLINRLKYNLAILQKISNDTKQLLENRIFSKYNKMNKERVFRKEIEEKNIYYLIKFINFSKKQKPSLLNCIKDNALLFQNIFYILIKTYCYLFRDKKKALQINSLETMKISDQKKIDVIFDEIREFIIYYEKEKQKFSDIYLKDILKIFETYSFNYSEIYFNSIIEMIYEKINTNLLDIDFSLIESFLNRNIFIFFYILASPEKSKNSEGYDNPEYTLDYSKYDKNIISFFFNEFLNAINPNLAKKYSPISKLFYDSIDDKKLNPKSIIKYEELKNYNHYKFKSQQFLKVMFYIYIKKTYPNYNSILLFYIFDCYFIEKINFYEQFFAIIKDNSNKNNIEKHLFLIKNEDIPKWYNKKIRLSYNFGRKKNNINNNFMFLFMNKYLLEMNYSKNSFVFYFIEKIINTKKFLNINFIRLDIFIAILFNYPFYENPSYDKKYFSEFIKTTFFEFLLQDNIPDDSEEKMSKRIKILEHIFKIFPNEQIGRDKIGWQNNLVNNWFNGLYLFLKIMKKENKNIFLLANNNFEIIKDILFTFCDLRKTLIHKKIKNEIGINNIKPEELHKRVEFILQEINEILSNILSQNDFKRRFPDNYTHKYEFIANFLNRSLEKLGERIYDYIRYYACELNNALNGIKNSKYELKINFEQFQSIISNVITIPQINENIRLKHFINIFASLFDKDINKFFSLLAIFKNGIEDIFSNNSNVLLFSLLKKNVQKFFENYSKIKSIINCQDDWYNNNELRIRIYILNNSKQSVYSKIDFINNLPSLENSYKLIRDLKNKDEVLFILKKIETLFNKNRNIDKIIDLMEYIVYNEHAVNHLFKSLKDNDIKELIKSGKYMNNIIKALFKFSEINGYSIIQKLLSLLSKNAPSLDLKSIILPPKNEPYDNMVNLEELNILDLSEDEKIDVHYKKMRYLLYYALGNRMVNNYETIAVLLEYCPFGESIEFLINEFADNDINNLFMGKIKHIEYFLNTNNKNKIKDLGKNFYSFFIFIESILKNKENIIKLTDQERYICINYIKIFLLEKIPDELLIFEENDKENDFSIKLENEEHDNNCKKNLLYRNETKLLTLLSLYEIKGNPIVSIKSQYPIFYSKIESCLSKFKSLGINSFSLKNNSDVEKFNKIKNIILNGYNYYILWRYPFQIFPNFMNLIKAKKSPNSFLSNNQYFLFCEYSVETLIFNLIRNKNVHPVYNYSINDNESFFSLLFNENVELESFYKPIIDSLSDFNKTSIYIIKNNNNFETERFKRNKMDNLPICLYYTYLKFVIELCDYFIKKCDNKDIFSPNIFVENLSNQDKNDLNKIKNTIKIEQLIPDIYNAFMGTDNDKMKEIYTALKLWSIAFLNKNEIMKDYNKMYKEQNNLLCYFKYLKLSCNILLHFIDTNYKQKDFEDNIETDNMIKKDIKCEIHYIYPKKLPKEEIKKAFRDLGNEVNHALTTPNAIVDYSSHEFIYNFIKVIVPIYFYFNDEKEEFLEVVTELHDYNFAREKFVHDYLMNYHESKTDINFFENRDDRLRNIFYNKLAEFIYDSAGIKIGKNNIDFFKERFEPFYLKYENYMKSFFNNILEVKSYPTYNDFELEMINEFKKYSTMYLIPPLFFNRNLHAFMNNVSDLSSIPKIDNYKIYVNLDELIKAIKENNYDQNNELDALFKIKAVNYIINGNSNVNYFIQELYSISYDKVNKSNKIITKRKKNIEEFFTIKIENGKKFDINEAKKLLTKDNLDFTNNKYAKKDLGKNFTKNNSKIFYSIVSLNRFKRKDVPDLTYKGTIPFSQYRTGKTLERNILNAFYNFTRAKDKTTFFWEIEKKNKKSKSSNKGENDFVNVFELMFSIKSLNNNVIVLQKNDISKILKEYSKNENTFKQLIEHSFNERKKENVLIDWSKINITRK